MPREDKELKTTEFYLHERYDTPAKDLERVIIGEYIFIPLKTLQELEKEIGEIDLSDEICDCGDKCEEYKKARKCYLKKAQNKIKALLKSKKESLK